MKTPSNEIRNWYAHLGRIGSKGRAKKLTKEQRIAIAKAGAAARWKGHKKGVKP